MMKLRYLTLLILPIILLSACTKKDNLTGTNWYDQDVLQITDNNAVVSAYSFMADDEDLPSLSSGRKNILVANHDGVKAKALLRFTNLLSAEAIDELAEFRNPKLNLEIARSSKGDESPISLKFYKVNQAYNADPDSILAENLEELTASATTWDKHTVSLDTLSVVLSYDIIRNWTSEEDSLGLNILVEIPEESQGFLELRPAGSLAGASISYEYKNSEDDEGYQDYKNYAVLNTFSFQRAIDEDSSAWRISNRSGKRLYIDLQPNFSLLKDADGMSLSDEIKKKTQVNHAELVLFVKDNPNFGNTVQYVFSTFLLKNRPESGAVIGTDDMVVASSIVPISNILYTTRDSLSLNITPLIQAYLSEKTFADGEIIEPYGILIMSNYEMKDFGEVDFWDILTAPEDKKPYIRIQYTPPFL
ncbi:MAG: hypothetical protein GX106_04775 [Candidatus Cloacimonetes bacterium]|jgi:hypothetical protein|nr:hypothetical protein [Candidatus Cloacimonadota bacterium]